MAYEVVLVIIIIKKHLHHYINFNPIPHWSIISNNARRLLNWNDHYIPTHSSSFVFLLWNQFSMSEKKHWTSGIVDVIIFFSRVLWLNIIKHLGLLWVFYDLRLATGLVSSIQRWEEWGVKGPIFTRSSCQLEGQMLRFGCEVYVALCLFYCFFIFLIIYLGFFFSDTCDVST